MGLSTKDLASSGGGSGMAKTIAPGNHILKINSIELEDFRFIEGAKHLILHVETEPIEGFEGFMINKEHPELGVYAGQIGKVKASQYAFADGETKSGVKIQRDRSIMIFLGNLAKTMGFNDWFLEQDDKFDTIESFVENFNKNAPYKGILLDFCIGGKEYEGKSGYTNYDMYLPKSEKGKYSITMKGDGKVIPYVESTHLKKIEVKNVESFGTDTNDLSIPKASTDFSLD